MAARMAISVIVPMLNEAPRIRAHLAALRVPAPHEIIVVDGGSSDDSAKLAQGGCDQVLVEQGGLAAQLNAGARAASGDVLFFPYVDTTLPERWTATIERTLGDSGVVAGAFRFALDSPRFCYRVIECGAALRNFSRLGPFGDQAIFVRRAAFESAQGFRHETLLEDLDLVRRLRRLGRVVIARDRVRSSVRRWEEHGVFRTAIRNATFLITYLAGRRGPVQQRRYQAHRQAGRSVDRERLPGRI